MNDNRQFKVTAPALVHYAPEYGKVYHGDVINENDARFADVDFDFAATLGQFEEVTPTRQAPQPTNEDTGGDTDGS